MKLSRILFTFTIIILLSILAACTQSSSSFIQPHCSHVGEVCLSISNAPSFSTSGPFQLVLTVKSTKDFPDLYVSLATMADVTVEGPQTWESNISSPSVIKGLAEWGFSIKAGQTINFTRNLHFPSRESDFQIIASVLNIGRSIDATISFYVAVRHNVGQVIMEGTPIPLLIPNNTLEVYGPGTPVPSELPSVITITPGIYRVVPSSTVVASPYPPPLFPQPIPQSTRSAYP